MKKPYLRVQLACIKSGSSEKKITYSPGKKSIFVNQEVEHLALKSYL